MHTLKEQVRSLSNEGKVHKGASFTTRSFGVRHARNYRWESDVRLPTYDEIACDEEQLDVYEAPLEESLFVVGPPGSGKTVLAVRRAQMLTEAGYKVFLVTYNRMLRRLVAQLTRGKVRAQTMHTFVRDHYEAQVSAQAPTVEPYTYDWSAMFEKLTRHGAAPKPSHVIVDEGQDLPKHFFQYLRRFVANTITVFADEDQALTEKRSELGDIKEAARLDDPVLLRANHRNTPEIARVAEFYHAGDAPVPEVIRPSSGELPRVFLYHENGARDRMANWYRTRGGRVGVAVISNETGRHLRVGLRNELHGQRVDFYEYRKQNEEIIDLLGPGITILNVQSIKGQEFDAVFLLEFDELLDGINELKRRRMYMLCARARDHLFLMHKGGCLPPNLLDQLPSPDILERP